MTQLNSRQCPSCIVCGSGTEPWLEKSFCEPEIHHALYNRCVSCGFVRCATIAELPDELWARLNRSFHGKYQGSELDRNDPNWRQRLINQARAVLELGSAGAVSTDLPWIDYGCGDGKLADLVNTGGRFRLEKFDPHMRGDGFLDASQVRPEGFSLLITTSVIEHLRNRAELDVLAGLVSKDGVLAMHTLVAEDIPRDPDWFYFLPVHCSFFTNASMRILIKDWGFRCSVYHPTSRLWFLFRATPESVEPLVYELNKGAVGPYHFKRGFMDFWNLNASDVMHRKSLSE